MKKLTVGFIAALAALVGYSYDWSGATGVVTLTESATVEDADAEFVAALTGIELAGADVVLTFNNTSGLTLSGYIRGEGKIVKNGTGDLRFGTPHVETWRETKGSLGSVYHDYHTAGGISILKGDLWFPQNGGAGAWYGPVFVDEGTVLHIHPDSHTGLDALNGAGTVDNGISWTWFYSADRRTLQVTNYGDYRVSNFSGSFVGNIWLIFGGEINLTGTDSCHAGMTTVYCNEYGHARLGHLGLMKFGIRPTPVAVKGVPSGDARLLPYASSVGLGSVTGDGTDLEIDYGGYLTYLGEGETTDKSLRLGSSYNRGRSTTLDGGVHGGVTFTGSIWQYNTDRMGGAVLCGSNRNDMVIACDVDSKGGVLHFKKKGTGSWRLGAGSRAGYVGAWFVEDGTLKFDSIAEIGEDCSMGLATTCFPFALNVTPSDHMAETNRLPYEIELGGAAATDDPVLEYSGTAATATTTRRIGLVGSGGTVSAGSAQGTVSLFGGAFAANAGEKTLTLDGSVSAAISTIGNISDGEGQVSVVKKGAGTWTLDKALTFSGKLDVKEGTLKVRGARQHYEWYRFTIMAAANGSNGDACKAANEIYLRYVGLWDKDGNRIIKNDDAITDVYPKDQMTEQQLSGSDDFIYPKGYWRGLQPGEITVGDFKGLHYRTWESRLPGQLLRQGSGKNLFWTYVGNNITLANENYWVPLVFRLPEGSADVAYFDVCQFGNHADGWHAPAYKLEASPDGETWTELFRKTTCDGCKAGCWDSTGVAFANDQNCVTSGFGHAINGSWTESDGLPRLTDVTDVNVAAGAELAAVGEVTLSTLTIDLENGGNGTIRGFDFAPNGVIRLKGRPRNGLAEVPFVLADLPAGALDRLNGWTCERAGYEITFDGETATVRAPGLAIIVK